MEYDPDHVTEGPWKGATLEDIADADKIVSELLQVALHPNPLKALDPPTMARIEANRRNALLSTGPKTEAGKKVSSRNALKFGIYSSVLLLPEENRDQYNALCDQYLSELQPEGLEELNLVEEMVVARWKLFRLNGIEQGVYHRARDWATPTPKPDQPEFPKPTAEVIFVTAGYQHEVLKGVACLAQMERALKRDFHRASDKLRALQAARKQQENEAPEQPEPVPEPIPETEPDPIQPIPDPDPKPEPPAVNLEISENEPTATPVGARPIPPIAAPDDGQEVRS